MGDTSSTGTQAVSSQTAAESNHLSPSQAQIRERVLAYYDVATEDYRVWSKGFNMHFGYWRKGMNPFRREAMLQETNVQVLARLHLPLHRATRMADLGGGTGATARTAVATYPDLSVDVITIAPKQVEIGNRLNGESPRGDAITMHCADFAATKLPDEEYDAVSVIESACHAEGATKPSILREAYRLLRPGGYFIMVDAMLLREVPTRGLLPRLMAHVYRQWCVSWAVPEMCRQDLLLEALEAQGFEPPTIEDWSWKIAPTIAHIPVLASYFAVAELIKARGILPLWRWRHIVASFLTPLIGLNRSTFTYAAVVARKPLPPPSSGRR